MPCLLIQSYHLRSGGGGQTGGTIHKTSFSGLQVGHSIRGSAIPTKFGRTTGADQAVERKELESLVGKLAHATQVDHQDRSL